MNDPALTNNVGDNERAAISTESQGIAKTRSSDENVEPPQSRKPPFALRWFSYLLLIPLMALATAAFGWR